MTVTLQAKFNKFIYVFKTAPGMNSFVKISLQFVFEIVNFTFDIKFKFESKLHKCRGAEGKGLSRG